MELLRRSPMLGVLASLSAGTALYDRIGIWAFAVIVPLVFAGVMFLSYEWELPEQWSVFIFAMAVTLLCSWRIYAVISEPPPENVIFIGETGTVTDVRQWGKVYATVIDTEARGKYVTFLRFPNFTNGARIKFDGETRNFRAKRNDSDFDEARYWRARGVNGVISLHNPDELPERFSLPLMRHKLSRKLSIYMPNLTSSYLRAVWTGERDSELTNKHRSWGTSHLLAVSGFHAGVVLMLAMFIFGGNAVALSVILWGYIFLTGASSSAVTSVLMIQLWLCGRIFGRKSEAVNSVSLAGVLLLMWSPYLFWDIGWRLSVISALLISAMLQGGGSWLMISPAVWLVTFPQTAYTFGGVPIAGFLLNMIAPMYFSFAFTIASLGGFLRLINFPLSHYFIMIAEGIFILWEKTADLCLRVFPQVLGWNYFLAWIGCGTLTFFVCRYLELAPLRTAAVMVAVGLTAFLVFL